MIHSRELNSPQNQHAEEYLQGWQRARAELDNFRKQIADQNSVAGNRHLVNIVTTFLPIADNFRAITEHLPPDLADNAWAQGVTHVCRQFQDTLQSLGLTEINQINVPFDPNIHEAVASDQADTDHSHTISAIIRPGYRLGETIIRPAQVQVK